MWQPIETAPKDGSAILVFCTPSQELSGYRREEDVEREVITTAYWDDYYPEWCLCVAWGYEAEQRCYEAPTHWQPLPPPPEK